MASASTLMARRTAKSRGQLRSLGPVHRLGVFFITNDALYPLSFDEISPTPGASEYLQDPSFRLLADFFRNKGLASLKREDQQESWYQDWIDYQAKHGLYASLLSPKQYSSRGNQFSLRRLTRFLETSTYFSPAHTYSLHVSFLGLFPILMSSNESLKQEAIAKLENGGLFAFGVSEKEHGADLFANEFTVTPAGPNGRTANGAKYYIGNANAACIISVLGKKGDGSAASTTKRSPFVFIALRPAGSPAFQNLKKIRTLGIRNAFVGGFDVKGYSLPESDVISQNRDAWDAMFGTINLGKYFLGFGSIGMCEHSFVETFAHLRRRVLYGKPVTEMPHIRVTTAVAFARMTAMKFYAYRALDYLQVANDDDRRYLLFTAVQKAKVSTEGVKVMALLSECAGARAMESDTYSELALRDSQLVPSLEGSTHINFGLTTQFLDSYFQSNDADVSSPESVILNKNDAGENPFLMQAHDRNGKTVAFADFLRAYEPFRSVDNVKLFIKQVKAFRLVAEGGVAALNPSLDAGVIISMGKCFSVVAYAQLVAENCLLADAAPSMVSVIFHGIIEDFSAEALKLSAMFQPGSAKRALLKRVVRVPKTIEADLESVYSFVAGRYGT